jgi:hypothetical protein
MVQQVRIAHKGTLGRKIGIRARRAQRSQALAVVLCTHHQPTSHAYTEQHSRLCAVHVYGATHPVAPV